MGHRERPWNYKLRKETKTCRQIDINLWYKEVKLVNSED